MVLPHSDGPDEPSGQRDRSPGSFGDTAAVAERLGWGAR